MNYNTYLSYQNDPLWLRLEHYSPDDPDAAHPLSSKLATEQKWSPEFTKRAIDEYRRFCYLCCTSPQGASPPPAVDEVWHLHLTYTREYWQRFCRDILGRELHHHPSRGGADEKERHDRWYTETLALYEQTFGHAPPQDIWPPPRGTSAPTPGKFHFFEAGPRKRYFLLLIPFLFITVFYSQPNAFRLIGPQFLWFYILLILSVTLVTIISLRWKRSLLDSIMQPDQNRINKFRLACLAGGEERYMLMCLSDLVANGHIIYLGKGEYCKGLVTDGNNPLLPSLLAMDKEQFTLKELVAPIPAQCAQIDHEFAALRKVHDSILNNILLPALTLLLGFARCMQGIINDRPVVYLVFLMAAVVLWGVPLLWEFGSLRRCMERLFRENVNYTTHIGDTTSRNLVLYGITALSGVMLYNNLRAQSARLVSTYPASADGGASGCGSSCGGGGGCGGGCGGCGG